MIENNQEIAAAKPSYPAPTKDVNRSVPFNITLLQLTPQDLANMKPVKSLDIFDGSSRSFHEEGLFSVGIFGRVGDERRSRRFAYIDMKIPVLHPVIYRALINLKRFYQTILSGKAYAVWSDEVGDFLPSNPVQGRTGYQFFIEHWKDIRFESRPSDIREQNIKLIKKFKDRASTDKLLVIPAGMRDIEISDGRIVFDEVNDLYKRVISYANAIHPDAVRNNPEALNTPRNSLQMVFNEIYDLFERMIEGKKKLLMGKWASRKVFNGTRNVITSMTLTSNKLGDTSNIGVNDTVVGLYQFLKGTLPVARFHIKSGFLSKVFPGPNAPAQLVNKKTLHLESVNLKAKYYDSWMTDEGLDKIITAFGEEAVRRKPLEIEGRYVGLIYKGKDGGVRMFQDIDELPEGFDPALVSPITFVELLYLSVYAFAKEVPVFVTRYPVTGFGSIYPSMTHLKTTVKTEHRFLLDDSWQPDPYAPKIDEFPTESDFVNALSPHPVHLQRLGADFDGDTASANFVYSKEARREAKRYLQSRRYYVSSEGRLNFGFATDTIKFIMKNMTGNPAPRFKEA